jgi:hypothetical protein
MPKTGCADRCGIDGWRPGRRGTDRSGPAAFGSSGQILRAGRWLPGRQPAGNAAIHFRLRHGPAQQEPEAQHTVAALAEQFVQPLSLAHLKGGEDALVADVLAMSGPVLIAWEHEAIPGIVNRITGNTTTCPQQWPDDRFDLVCVLDQASQTGNWELTQVVQLLLPGDSDTIIPQPT